MNLVLWSATAFLVFIFVTAGVEKLATPVGEQRVRRAWAQRASTVQIHALGALEVLGAVGLVLPAITGIAPGLVALAAMCLLGLMLGAIAAQARVGAPRSAYVLPVVVIVVCLVVAVGRVAIVPL